jgi:hypothetical protein
MLAFLHLPWHVWVIWACKEIRNGEHCTRKGNALLREICSQVVEQSVLGDTLLAVLLVMLTCQFVGSALPRCCFLLLAVMWLGGRGICSLFTDVISCDYWLVSLSDLRYCSMCSKHWASKPQATLLIWSGHSIRQHAGWGVGDLLPRMYTLQNFWPLLLSRALYVDNLPPTIREVRTVSTFNKSLLIWATIFGEMHFLNFSQKNISPYGLTYYIFLITDRRLPFP